MIDPRFRWTQRYDRHDYFRCSEQTTSLVDHTLITDEQLSEDIDEQTDGRGTDRLEHGRAQ